MPVSVELAALLVSTSNTVAFGRNEPSMRVYSSAALLSATVATTVETPAWPSVACWDLSFSWLSGDGGCGEGGGGG